MIAKNTKYLISLIAISVILSACSADSGHDTSNVRDKQDEAEYVSKESDTSEASDDSDASETPDENTASESKEPSEDAKTDDLPDVIWLGDSLTQGSLGEDNNNENNPQAPWRVLAEISGLNVIGYGYYGCITHDILWKFGEEGGIKDPDVIYVYWVGSNDFHESPEQIKYVIEETDRFNNQAGIDKYLFLGTTTRGDMDPNACIGINNNLEEYYGEHYLDIMPYVEYGPDGVHLTEDSYRKVAEAVYDKLIDLNYLAR